MKTSQIRKGLVVWIPCEVRSGPFPDERRVYVQTGLSEWFGFVNTSELKSKVEIGKDSVRAVVIATTPDHVVVGIQGQSPASGPIQAKPSLITSYGAVAT